MKESKLLFGFPSSLPARALLIFGIGLFLGLVFGLILPGVLPGSADDTTVPSELLFLSPGQAAMARQGAGGASSADGELQYGESQEADPRLQKDFPVRQLASQVPLASKDAYLAWMKANRGEDAFYCSQRWDLAMRFRDSGELGRPEDVAAFLLTPREKFVREQNLARAYEDTWMPIGYGATITDPDVVAMMTTTLQVEENHRVLEIGTGSGYQSCILSNLSRYVYSIEIIKPLFRETNELYKSLTAAYPTIANISRKLDDGFYGWEKYAPFDRIIVTCAIDHIPPPLLRQLAPDGIMVLPLGPPGRQYIMEVKKSVDAAGNVTLLRRDVYNGMHVKFIPFRDEAGKSYSAPETLPGQ